MQAAQLWSRFRGRGVRIPLALDGARGSDAFLRALFGGGGAAGAPRCSPASAAAPGSTPLDAWIVESGEALHACTEPVASAASGASAVPTSTGLSYDRLRGYRDDLTRALYDKIQAGVESPQAFAAYARSLRIAPRPGALRHAPDVVQAFVRDLFLTGNGTLFVNNTFVEWAAVQAIRRAEPRLLVARYGVRDKMKPFSSLLLFSQPRASDQIPLHRGSRRLVHRRRAAVALRLAERGEEPGLPPAHAAPPARRRHRRHARDSIGRGRDPRRR